MHPNLHRAIALAVPIVAAALLFGFLTNWPGCSAPTTTPGEKTMRETTDLREELSGSGLEGNVAQAMECRLKLLEQFSGKQVLADQPRLNERISNELANLRDDLKSFQKGEGLFRKNHSTLLAYHSDLDDSYQPFEIFLPRHYDGREPRALIVLLHGMGGFGPLQCQAREIGEAIVAAPQGRGAMDYMFVGEDDVLRVIEETCRLFPVDPERIYLAGSSMGGTGCWHLASRYPDRFGGIAAGCGNTDVQVWRERWLWRVPKDSPQAEVREFLRDDTSSATYAANLWNVPIVALHGEEDQINNRGHADRMLAALKELKHPNCRFILLPLVQHGFSVDFEKALDSFKRVTHPTRVTYATAWLRYPGSAWLRITGFQRRLRRASVDGEADPKSGAVKVATQNVSRLEVVAKELPPMDGPVHLTLDGQALPFDPPNQAGTLIAYVRGPDGQWAPAAEEASTAFPPAKNATVEGPLEHVFMSRFLLVAPDGTGPNAEAAQRAVDDLVQLWRQRYAVPCRTARADEVSEDDIQRSNLILFGLPADNSLLARIAPKLPVTFEADGFALGGVAYRGPNAGLKLCYPNPLAPQRYVAVMSGVTPESYVAMHLRLGNWFDWICFDYRQHFDVAVFDDLTTGRHPESMPVWGFFGERWEVRPDLLFTGVPAYRQGRLPRKLPTLDLARLREAGSNPPKTLYLDDLKALSANIPKEYLERNRTLEGSPLVLVGDRFERGLCCRFPCTLTFPCEGYTRLTLTAGVEWDGVTEPSADRAEAEDVLVKVQADDNVVFEAKEQTYRDKPLIIDVDLNGARRVTLSASGGRVWLNGSFIWADARLER
jgi:pimeloyl-ACP methyl ester carboxylesterase